MNGYKAGEMGPLVKHLLYENEERSSVPGTHNKIVSMTVCTVIPAQERQRQEDA